MQQAFDQFEYVSSLGEGAYGQVWLCKIRDTGQKVAMKRFKEAHQDPEVMRLAMREIKLLKASQHENVVQLMEAFRSRSGRVYMVMEHVERTLTQDLRKYSRGFPPALAKMISWQLLQAASFLHKRKVMHRDLKPANILLSSDNVVKICDFGFARTLHSKETADYTTYVVTRWYRPPEVLVNDEYGPKIDVWAIGCLMCEMTSGRPMFPGKTSADQLWLTMLTLGPLPPRQANLMAEDPSYDTIKVPSQSQQTPLEQRFPAFPAELMEVVKGCLALDPEKRLSADEAMAMPYFKDVPQIISAKAEATAAGHDFWGTLEASWQQQVLAGSSGPGGSKSQPKRSTTLRNSKSCSQRSLAHSLPLPRASSQVFAASASNQLSEPYLNLQAQQAQLAQLQQKQMLLQQSQLLQQQTELMSLPSLNSTNLHAQQAALQEAQQQQQQQQTSTQQQLQHQPSAATAASGRPSLSNSLAATGNFSMVCTPSSMAASQLQNLHRPSTPGSVGSFTTHITAPLTPLPIQQLRRAMSQVQVQGLGSQLCGRSSSTGVSECNNSMAILSESSSLQRATSGTPCGTPDGSGRQPLLSSYLTASFRMAGSEGLHTNRFSETNVSTASSLLGDFCRGHSQDNQPLDTLFGYMPSASQSQVHGSSPRGGSPKGGTMSGQHHLAGASLPLPGGPLPSSRRSSQVLQFQPNSHLTFPASRLSMLNSNASPPKHRRQGSGGAVGGGLGLAHHPCGSNGPGNRRLASTSMGHVLDAWPQPGHLSQRLQGTPMSSRSCMSNPGSVSGGVHGMGPRSAGSTLVPAAPALQHSMPHSSIPLEARQQRALSTGSRPPLASAFASPLAQHAHNVSGSREQAVRQAFFPIGHRSNSSSSSCSSSKRREPHPSQMPQLAEQQTAEGGGSTAPKSPKSEAAAMCADTGAGTASQQHQAEVDMEGLAEKAGPAALSSKQPSLFKLMKTRLSALTSFRGSTSK